MQATQEQFNIEPNPFAKLSHNIKVVELMNSKNRDDLLGEAYVSFGA